VQIASIPAEARRAADNAGLVTQRDRLEIAKATDPVAKVREITERKQQTSPADKSYDRLVAAWVTASYQTRARFMAYVS
jgi:hypothetical protein